MSGHQVIANLNLLSTEDGGLTATIVEGNKSLIFVFEEYKERCSTKLQFGAVIDCIRSGSGEPGGSPEVELWFWIDQAAIYATTDSSFDLWYAGRVVGDGNVVAVLDELDGD